MNKLKMHSKDKTQENFEILQRLFPNAVTETIIGYDEDGKAIVERAIDKDVLQQEINAAVVEGKDERYQFTWPDKKRAIVSANAPINKTLRPCREESVDFDNTENLYIEGDNLEVLKLLQETYLGKIKMIYIDPPYNTGHDFVYNDKFSVSADEWDEMSGELDEYGNRLTQNTESNGRFHTDWLNMIYPRLKIARDLLSDDGVIFISIDDNEVENLKKICDEVFGADNFVCQICVKMSHLSGMKMSHKNKKIPKIKEFIIMYIKDITRVFINPVYVPGEWEDVLDRYNGFIENYNQDISYWRRVPLNTKLKGMNNDDIIKYRIKNADRIFRTAVNDSFSNTPKDNTFRKATSKNGLVKIIYNAEEVIFASSKLQSFDGELLPADTIGDIWLDIGINNLHNEGGVPFPNGKKPIKLIKRLLEISSNEDSIILDFFSGSATTAHAVMKQNFQDVFDGKKGKRKFIMVQLPEKTDEKSEAYKAGYKNICEIGKERIRRAGELEKKNAYATAGSSLKWNDERKAELGDDYACPEDVDIGFRVLKLDSSNMKDVYYNPADFSKNLLDATIDNIKEDRTAEDLLFQVMLDLGVLLSSKIEETEISGKKVFNVADGFLIACFDNDVNEVVITAVAKQQPIYFVMRDSSLSADTTATNFDQIFETYSPDTVRKVI